MCILQRSVFCLLAFGTLGGAMAATARAAELISTHTDWKVYRHAERGERLCFAATAATEQKLGPGGRGTPYAYVTAWPKAGIKTEISINLGFDLDKGDEVSVDISGNSFSLLADGDRAYAGDGSEETKLMEAMRRGKTMTVEATSSAGARSRDVFSLSGLTASVQAAVAGCN